MEIKSEEVESIKTVGKLNDYDVKIVKTFGGFYCAVGKKTKHSKSPECLCAGSHIALLNYELSKQFGSSFEPIMQKSEQEAFENVEEKTDKLPNDFINKGLQLFVLSKSNNIDFILYKNGLTIAEYKGEIIQDSLVIKKSNFRKDLFQGDLELAKILSNEIKIKANELDLSNISVK